MVNVSATAMIPIKALEEVLPFVVRWDSDCIMGNPEFPQKEFLRRLLDFANDSSIVSRRDFAIWLDNTDWNSRDFLRRFAKLPESTIVRCFDYEAEFNQMLDTLREFERIASDREMFSVFGVANARQIYKSLDRFSITGYPEFVIVIMVENLRQGEFRSLLFDHLYGQNSGYSDRAELAYPIEILLDLQALHNAKHGLPS